MATATGADALKQNLTIQAGATFRFTFTTADQNGDPIDLTLASSIRAEIRSRDGRLLGTFTTANGIPATDGVIVLSMAAAATLALEGSFGLFPAQYDVLVEFTNTTVDRVLEGQAVLSRAVTA